jgi:hypothetical protein
MAVETGLVVCVDKMAGTINIKMKKKILEIHSEWLKQNGYNKEYKNCVKQTKNYDPHEDVKQIRARQRIEKDLRPCNASR